jgi:HEPN domain-containing protein
MRTKRSRYDECIEMGKHWVHADGTCYNCGVDAYDEFEISEDEEELLKREEEIIRWVDSLIADVKNNQLR